MPAFQKVLINASILNESEIKYKFWYSFSASSKNTSNKKFNFINNIM